MTPTLESIMRAAFDCPRDPRSPAYRLGCETAIRRRLAGETAKLSSVDLPFRPGTAECDAWHAGYAEGRHLVEQALMDTDTKEARP